MKKSTKFAALILGLASAIAAVPASADNIISETSGGTAGSSPSIYSGQIGAASWTTTSAYSNVSIDATVGCYRCSGSMTAYLTTTIGPSETVADQIATSTVSVGAGPEQDTFFSGLSLGAGTYYLVLTNGDGDLYYWLSPNGAGGTSITTGTGVTYNGDYLSTSPFNTINGANPPASTWTYYGDNGLNFQVTGDPASVVPEPSSSLLLASGLAGFAGIVRRKLRA
jgi:hypothetical protein